MQTKEESMRTGNETTPEKLMQDLNVLVRDGEELLKSGAHEARAKLGQVLDSAKATGLKLKEKAAERAKATDQVIREHPYQSIGLAFGVGLLIGVLVNRK